MTLFALLSAACSSSDDDGGDTPGGNSSAGNQTDCIAASAVKTLKIASGTSYDNIGKMYLIYEDYTYRYYLGCFRGSVILWPYPRVDGHYMNGHVQDHGKKVYGIKPFSNVGSLQILTDGQKTEATEGCRYENYEYAPYYHYSYATFAPGCGFIAWFKTETENARYVRIRSTNYTLDDTSSLSSISIEYQLF